MDAAAQVSICLPAFCSLPPSPDPFFSPFQRRKLKKPFFPFFSGSSPAAALAIQRMLSAIAESTMIMGAAVSRFLRAEA